MPTDSSSVPRRLGDRRAFGLPRLASLSAALRGRPWSILATFGIVFAVTLIVALGQGLKTFYYDSGEYWRLGQTFTVNGHFSLLNFTSSGRGYALPLIDHGLQEIAEALVWNPSSLAKLFNVLLFALIGAVLAPRLAEIAWPRRRWGPLSRLALVAFLLVFWRGYLNFPLSDFPALAMVLVALVSIARQDAPGWMLLAGVAGGLALDMRASYIMLEPILAILVIWAWFDQRGTRHASIARRALCAGLLVLGFAAASLPQSLSSHRHGFTWSPVPGATSSVASLYLTPGMANQRYDTYVGGDRPPQAYYEDASGAKLLQKQRGERIESTGQYVGLIVSHPVAMVSLLARHLINGLDARYSTVYVEQLDTDSISWPRIAGFLLVFLALARVLWPTARRRLGPAKWRYPVALLLCGATSVPTSVEARYMLPAYLLSYMLVLTPGWPNPVGPATAGVLRRYQTAAILLVSYLAFMAVVWHVTSVATDQLVFK
jgi:hypothetical protein